MFGNIAMLGVHSWNAAFRIHLYNTHHATTLVKVHTIHMEREKGTKKTPRRTM